MTLNDIARLAGVSKATVSRAFSNPDLVNTKTRDKVLTIARQYNFRPNAMAQAVATKKSGLIGFCIYNKSRPFFGHSFFGPILDGVTEQAKSYNYHVVLAFTDKLLDNFEESFIEDGIEGALLSTFAPIRMVEIFKTRKIPVVIINDEIQAEHTGCIVDDNYGGARKIMSHLLDQRGYRSIAFMSDRVSHPSYMLRYIGYLSALKEHGLQPYANAQLPAYDLLGKQTDYNRLPLARYGYTEIPVVGTPIIIPELTMDNAYKHTKLLLKCNPLPRAIFCTADTIAVGAIKAIHDSGLRVPEDIAVTGYDDIAVAHVCSPDLTTISVDRQSIGLSGMQLLKNYIDNPHAPSTTLTIGNTLVVRHSS